MDTTNSAAAVEAKRTRKAIVLKVGDVIKAAVNGRDGQIVKVWPLGTYDVECNGRYYRVTGLYGAFGWTS